MPDDAAATLEPTAAEPQAEAPPAAARRPVECGANVGCGGRCRACGAAQRTEVRHGGHCPACGGQMACRQTQALGRSGRCPKHGGNNPVGPMHPTYGKRGHSRYAGDMPLGLASIIKDIAKHGGDLLSSEPEIELLTARIKELTRKLKTGESGAAWAKVNEAEKRLQASIRSGDTDALQRALNELHGAIQLGGEEGEVWEEMQAVMQRRAAIVTVEARRQNEAKLMLRLDEAMAFVSAVVDSVKQRVEDKTVRALISQDLAALMGGPLPKVPSAAAVPVVVDAEVISDGNSEETAAQ